VGALRRRGDVLIRTRCSCGDGRLARPSHNPLSRVILNERRFCASEEPRRAPANRGPQHARFWRDGVGDASRSLRGNTRAFGTLPYHPPAKLVPTNVCVGTGLARPSRAKLGSACLSASSQNPLYPCHSEPLAGRARAPRTCEESASPIPVIPASSRNSEIRTPAQPRRGGITTARHVSAGSAADRAPARFTGHHHAVLFGWCSASSAAIQALNVTGF
jgi:hypothetical protein